MYLLSFKKQIKWIVLLAFFGFFIGLAHKIYYENWLKSLTPVYICLEDDLGIGLLKFNEKDEYFRYLSEGNGKINFKFNVINRSDRFFFIEEKEGLSRIFVIKGPNLARQNSVKVWVKSDFIKSIECEN